MALRAALAGLLVLAAASWANQLPETWPRCRRKDPNLDLCLRHAIQVAIPQMAAGVPELELPPLDEANMREMFMIERKPGRISLQLKVTNLRSYGLPTLKVHSVFSDLDNGVIDMYASMPLSIMNADMEVEGTILSEPVSPQRGNANFTFTDLEGLLVISGRTVERNGSSYWDIDYARGDILSLGGLAVNFDPLDKSPQRSAKLNYLLSTNVLAMWPDLREAIQTMHAREFRALANRVFSKVPLKDIFLDDNHPAVQAGPSSLVLYGR